MAGALVTSLVPLEGPVGDLSLAEWADTFTHFAQVAAGLALTSWVPRSLHVANRGQYDAAATAANVTSAVMAARELGIQPMAALRSINVINGTPALSAQAMLAIAQSRGHSVWVVESTNSRAVVDALRAGDPPERTQRVSYTTDDAQKAGLMSKDNWRRQPRAMCVARATSAAVRLVAADALLGLPYSLEELADTDGELPSELPEVEPTANGQPPKRRARRANVPALLSPPAPPAPEVEPEDDEGPPMISDPQRRALQATFRDLGVVNRSDRLASISRIVNRDVTSSAELTAAEANAVLDELNKQRARAANEPGPDEGPSEAEGQQMQHDLDEALHGNDPNEEWPEQGTLEDGEQ